MTNDKSDLPLCSRLVYNLGVCVFITDSIPPREMEEWVKKVRQKAGFFAFVDWHECAGQYRVLAFGRIGKILKVMQELKAEHDELWRKASPQAARVSPPPAFLFQTT